MKDLQLPQQAVYRNFREMCHRTSALKARGETGDTNRSARICNRPDTVKSKQDQQHLEGHSPLPVPNKSASRITFRSDEKTVPDELNKFFISVGENTVNKVKSLANECKFELNEDGLLRDNIYCPNSSHFVSQIVNIYKM